MRRHILITLIILVTSLGYCFGQEKKVYSNIDKERLSKEILKENVQLIDVRTPKEYENGYIGTAKNIDFYKKKKFKASIEKLNKNEPVYLYCKSGVRSKRASKILEELGFKTIYNYSGGWDDWSEDDNK